jgi:CO/xanthine dehydrogenase Mo-binding subunit
MGGATQGIGNALYEEMIYDETGTLQNATLYEYHVPTIADMPESFSSNIVENEDGPGPYGAKGVGEGALAGVTAAIATALADAGIHINELPATPERIWWMMQNQNAQTTGSTGDAGDNKEGGDD